jgi:flagella basal body P-ring formation protein FlgA
MSLNVFRVVRPAAWLVVAAACLAAALPARAQVQPASDEPVKLDAATEKWLGDAVARAQEVAGAPLRMEVSVGSLDSRLRLQPCAKVEPHMPVGTRLWGKTRLGLRCVDGNARWNVFLPITIKAFGPAWVLRDNVLPGQTLTEADAVEAEADWAAENSPVLADPRQWVGQAASRALVAGQPLRQSMVRAAQVFGAGTQVRVTAQGPGFQIASSGQALTAGVMGQSVRVRLDNGRIASGTVVDARTVQMDM